MPLFDYDFEGHSLVVADGTEVLVYDGGTEAPRWKTDVGVPLVGVASNAIAILTLDKGGELRVWSHETATEVKTFSLGISPTALVSDFAGRSGAVHAGGMVRVSGGDLQTLTVEGASAAAFGSDDGVLVGTGSGELHRFDAAGALVGSAQVSGPVHDIAWNAQGFFLIAAGASVYRLDELEVSHVTNSPDGLPVNGLACSETGDRIALQVDKTMAVVMAYPSRETLGHVIYGDRPIGGTAFGPLPWFGVGLDLGDANKFNLDTGATHRSDTHPGRAHNQWILMSAFGPRPVPGGHDGPAAPPAPSASKSLLHSPVGQIGCSIAFIGALVLLALLTR